MRPTIGRRIERLCFALAAACIVFVVVFGLFITKPDRQQGEQVRLLYIHPALAWSAYLAFFVTTICSVLWLVPRTRNRRWDRFAAASAEVGSVFIALTILTGSIWGRATWGVWWAWWDARLVSTLVLLFLYLGVLALRAATPEANRRATLSAIAALGSFLVVPIVNRAVEWWDTLHQTKSVGIDGDRRLTIFMAVLGLTFLYIGFTSARARLLRWEDEVADYELQAALGRRRSEGAPLAETPGLLGTTRISTNKGATR